MKRTIIILILLAGLCSTQTSQAQSTDKVVVAVITNAEGAHLSAYFPALKEAQEVTSVVLSDPSGKIVEQARKYLGDKLTATYTDTSEMLKKEKPVMALVSLEAALSPPAIDLALEAGCHVMAEKPACLNAEDFARLTKKANDKKLLLMLALANRLNPETQEAKRIIREGKIGKIYGMEVHLIADQTRLKSTSYHKKWYAKKDRAGGGHLIWLGIHWLDMAMYLTESKITNVAGFAGNVGGQPIDVEDSAALAVKFDNGTFGTVTSGFYLDKSYHSHLKIWGSDGWLQIDRHGGFDSSPLRWYSSKVENPEVTVYTPPEGPQGYSPFVAACVRAAIGKGPAPLTADDSLQVLKTVYGAYRAAETGQTQKIE